MDQTTKPYPKKFLKLLQLVTEGALKFVHELKWQILICSCPFEWSQFQVSSDFLQAEAAASIPCISATGVGGQPGIATSTGMTLEILPQVA